MAMIKAWRATDILNRANELGIEISLAGDAGDKLKLGSDNPIPQKVKEVVKTHKQIIIDHLKKQQELEQQQLEAWLEQQDVDPLCCICFEQGLEFRALPESFEGMMYCREHHPSHGMYKQTILSRILAIDESLAPMELLPSVSTEEYKSARMREIVARERAKDEQLKLANRRQIAFRRG